jgi:transposase
MSSHEQVRSGHVVIGVHTHKRVHVAAALDPIGGIVGTLTIPTATGGFQQPLDWSGTLRRMLTFGIEGTGSYRATLTSSLRRSGHRVVEGDRIGGYDR